MTADMTEETQPEKTEPLTVRYTDSELTVAEELRKLLYESSVSAVMRRALAHFASANGLTPPAPRKPLRGRRKAA